MCVKRTDICEDAEIRERIEQLKSEQESKRLAEAQRRRVRRSQSNNTRYTIKAVACIQTLSTQPQVSVTLHRTVVYID